MESYFPEYRNVKIQAKFWVRNVTNNKNWSGLNKMFEYGLLQQS